MTNKTITMSRELAENLLHCGVTSSFITPSITTQLRAVIAKPVVELDERAEFEKWLRDQPHVVNLGFNKQTGKYTLQEDEDSWQAWQARATIAAPIVEADGMGEAVERKPDAIIEGVLTSAGISHAIYACTVSLKDKEQVKLYASQPAPVSVVLPARPLNQGKIFDRMSSYEKGIVQGSAEMWDKVKELNQ